MRRRRGIQEEETETEAAFGVLVAEECFYLAAREVGFKAVNKTKTWQETVMSAMFEPERVVSCPSVTSERTN